MIESLVVGVFFGFRNVLVLSDWSNGSFVILKDFKLIVSFGFIDMNGL